MDGHSKSVVSTHPVELTVQVYCLFEGSNSICFLSDVRCSAVCFVSHLPVSLKSMPKSVQHVFMFVHHSAEHFIIAPSWIRLRGRMLK